MVVGSGHSKVSQGSFGPTMDSNAGPSFKPKMITNRTGRIFRVLATFVAKKATSGGPAMPVNDRTTPRLQPGFQQMHGQQGQQPPPYYPPASPALPPMQPRSSGPRNDNVFLALAEGDAQKTQIYRQQPA